MTEVSSMKFSIQVPGASSGSSISRLTTLESVISWIKSHQLDDYTTKGLIVLASRYPNNALPLFKKNFHVMLQRVRANRKKEGLLDDQTNEKETIEERRFEEFDSIEEGINSKWDDSDKNQDNSKPL